MTGKNRLETFLREQGMRFFERHHPEYFTAQEVAASEHVPGRRFAKVVMVVADGKLTMLVLPAPRQVDLAKTAAVLGAKEVRLATKEEIIGAFPDCEEGSAPPFGNLYNIPVWVDARLARQKDIVVEAGTHSETLGLKYADFERGVHPTVAEFTRPAESMEKEAALPASQ